MSNLTQGNWKARSRYMEAGTQWSVIDKENRSVANIMTADVSDEDQLRLNANLIAAAPDLLKFAEHFMAELEDNNITTSRRAAHQFYDAMTILRVLATAAITKAKGEQL